MNTTYAAQRQIILNADPIDTILSEWPFLGKELYLKKHFYHLTNIEDTVINHFKTKIPTMLKFVQAEAERKRKDINQQTRLMDIIKNHSNNKNNYSDLLAVLLCYMAIMKENVELMFIIFEDTCSLDEVQSDDKIISTPVIACLGDIWSNPKCFVFVDKQCLWREPLAVDVAIIIMFVSFYVFNIQYPKELAGILQFLQSSMFGINDEGNKVKKKTSAEKFVSKLLKLMKDYDSYVKKWTC
ncbi:Uncharacterized protein FWK35_00023816 [Aphis craccivora]|uniref:Uncharacterized protein n=1 Tax=Aphis craccivora TaxID=307492 RepID=A0A6G0XIR4_APHCR|nr:Uncharacterized protein FWK35_00023816 [Aphis craccivora]